MDFSLAYIILTLLFKTKKNTVNRYISNTKKLQNEINQFKSISTEDLINNKKFHEISEKIKFFQDENVRLASDLLSVKNKYNILKDNFTNIEQERTNISNQIHNLNETINNNTNSNILENEFKDELSLGFEEEIFEEELIENEIKETKDSDVENLNKDINNIFTV